MDTVLNPTVNPWEKLGFNYDQAHAIRRAYRLKYARWAAENKNILEWGWALFPEKFTIDFCPELHAYLAGIRLDPFTATKAPRFHAKTTIGCFLIPLFQALEEPQSFRHYLNVQGTEPKALEINRSIKLELEENELLRAMYGDMVGERWTDSRFVLKNNVVFSAISTGQSIRGINYRNIRPDYIMVDDLYDEEDINNPDSTEKKNQWFWGSLYLCRSKTRKACVHLTGTAINDFDLLTQCEKNKDVICRTFKNFDFNALSVLWPALGTYDHQKAEFDRMPISVAMRELQNEPRDEATAIIKHSWLYPEGAPSWEFDPDELDKRIRTGKILLVGIWLGNDPSIGKKGERKGATSDYTGTGLIWETKPLDSKGGCDYWIMGAWEKRMSLDERCEQLLDIGSKQPPDRRPKKAFIEAIGGFDDYASFVITRTNIPVQRVEWVPDKLTNLENRSHHFQNRKIHLNERIDQSMKQKLVYQLTVNHPTHDDVRDAVLLPLELYSHAWKAWV